MKSLIGKKVKMNYGFPLDNEIFEIIGERKKQVEVQGDFSAGTHNVTQSEWTDKKNIVGFIEYEQIPCNNCQGGGCPVCSGFGYLTEVIFEPFKF